MANELVHVPFHGDVLEAIQTPDRKVWVHLRRVCDILGLDHEAQRKRLVDPDRCPWATASIMEAVAQDGKTREVTVLDLDSFPMWLATISVGHVRDDLRPKIIAYQKECVRVLREHFFGPVTTGDSILDSLERTRRTIDAIAETRRRQIALERAQAVTHELAEEAHQVATAALCQATMNHGHFAVIGYSRLMGREMTLAEASQHGRELSGICRTRNIRIGNMTDPRFGRVNTYPESLLREYFGDEATIPFASPIE
jgi:P22_AR N-terminal domain